ncbi:hypothetical protein NPS01_27970 [Nocardioides psychrotolerans]|uniref:Uncharacterized protein n=1 Tax=Nocardioides psychrotolerans TaxID=1005945 RepID=A0A1I3EUC6_9ACTN|nr:hypothetical protein [Nocardioides psychrotolerans]GEP39134.1 hypothetical protein NPS01_27970 [Nocardioides psychrotolerans]SFI02615.1 hypothetical protein SAMN05216561_10475 [Nocardioides psychrotolerans]
MPGPRRDLLQRVPWRRWGRFLGHYTACCLVVAIGAAPVIVVRAVESTRFEDRLGTLPVEVSLTHNGRSTLDTGIFGKVYWRETGPFGIGAQARVTGPPEAGGTLASYADSRFISTNVALINDPDMVVDAYAAQLAATLQDEIVKGELVAGLLGGGVLLAIVPWRRLRRTSHTGTVVVVSVLAVAATGLSAGAAVLRFDAWSGSEPVTGDLRLPGVDRLSFDSPETLEVARQVQPFIEKNTQRIEQRGAAFVAAAQETFASTLDIRGETLRPREGETLVIAEGDPQGSLVGTRARTAIYADLLDFLGPEAVTVRTISGDITSNGTVAEEAFVEAEARAGGDLPVVAVAGDHDTEATWQQMEDAGMETPDLDTVDIGELRLAGGHDREHKALFGALVENTAGISEEELGAQLRDAVGDEPSVVLLHQPDAAAGFLGLDDLDPVRELPPSLTTPVDDGIPDQLPGTLSIGHLHETAGPWVIWNTDGDQVTWTVVDQLGTSGGVENAPTFNRFSTPVSVPLKPISVRLQYVDVTSGLQTGYASLVCDVEATCSLSDRVDVGLPGGEPGPVPGG